VKTIPPYKPIPADNGSDSSPEKESESMVKAGVSGKRKGAGKATSSSSAVGVKSGATGGKTVVSGHSPSLSDSSSIGASGDVTDVTKSSTTSVGLKDASNLSTTAVMGTSAASSTNSGSTTKFTTSNFVETVVTQSESVFGADIPTVGQANMRISSATTAASTNVSTGTSSVTGKKRKAGGSRTPTTPDNSSDIATVQTPVSVVSGSTGMPAVVGAVMPVVGNVSVSSSGGNESHGGTILGDSKKLKVESGGVPGISGSTSNPLSGVSESVVVSNVNSRPLSGNVITSAPSAAGSVSSAISSGGIVVSVPLAAASIHPPTSAASTVVTSAPTLFQQLQQSSVVTSNAAAVVTTIASATESRLQAVAQQQQHHPEDQPGKRARLVNVDLCHLLFRMCQYKYVSCSEGWYITVPYFRMLKIKQCDVLYMVSS